MPAISPTNWILTPWPGFEVEPRSSASKAQQALSLRKCISPLSHGDRAKFGSQQESGGCPLSMWRYWRSNVTGHHQSTKQKLPAGYRASSLQRTSHRATVVIVECGIARFLCTMHVCEVQASSSSPRLPLYQISFIYGLYRSVNPWREVVH